MLCSKNQHLLFNLRRSISQKSDTEIISADVIESYKMTYSDRFQVVSKWDILTPDPQCSKLVLSDVCQDCKCTIQVLSRVYQDCWCQKLRLPTVQCPNPIQCLRRRPPEKAAFVHLQYCKCTKAAFSGGRLLKHWIGFGHWTVGSLSFWHQQSWYTLDRTCIVHLQSWHTSDRTNFEHWGSGVNMSHFDTTWKRSEYVILYDSITSAEMISVSDFCEILRRKLKSRCWFLEQSIL